MSLLCSEPPMYLIVQLKHRIHWAPAGSNLFSNLSPLILHFQLHWLCCYFCFCSTIPTNIHRFTLLHPSSIYLSATCAKIPFLSTLYTIPSPNSSMLYLLNWGLYFSIAAVTTSQSTNVHLLLDSSQLECKYPAGKDCILFAVLLSIIRIVLGQQ